jgi:NitT/TauT family transport system substrate-binding protein
MKNKLILFILSFILIIFASGCSKADNLSNESQEPEVKEELQEEEIAEKIDIKIGAPAGSPLLSAVKLFGEDTQFETANATYEIIKSPDKIPAMIINEEIDMGIIPTNLASILYNKEVPYKLVSANVFGVMYVITDGSVEINSLEDLKGKEIYTMGRNLTPDITFRYILENSGINPDEDMTLNYLSGATELAPAFLSGKASIVVMPEPMVSLVMSKNENTEIVFNIQEEWSKITGTEGGYPQASLFVKNDIIENHKDLLEEFLSAYEESCNWVNANSEEAGTYYEKLVEGIPGKIISKSVPGNNIRFSYAEDISTDLNKYLETLFQYDPKTVGGKLPDEGFYYKK